jgi:hypothetical protein
MAISLDHAKMYIDFDCSDVLCLMSVVVPTARKIRRSSSRKDSRASGWGIISIVNGKVGAAGLPAATDLPRRIRAFELLAR